MTDIKTDAPVYKPKEFQSGQDVRWCPGCGDYSILAQVQKVFPTFGKRKEEMIWISGIGCSSRFPYYMSTYGFHTIHGRAAAIATGLKLARPDLMVWVASGDGDSMSIGGNHFIHACRKNIDLNLIMFNNRIYGLTKGQYSPTSEPGKVTKSSPYGSIDNPFNPASLALGSDASFVARSIDRNPKHLQEMIKRAGNHKGFSFLEVYQNCNIFNDGAYLPLTEKGTKLDTVVELKHGEPMIFGSEKNKGIILEGFTPKVVDLGEGKYKEEDLWIHDETDENPIRSFIIAHMTDHPELPTPIGVIRAINRQTLNDGVNDQVKAVTEKKGEGTLKDLLYGGNTWVVD